MWTTGNQRIKALVSAREREQARLSRPIHLSRADVRIKIPMPDGEERIVAGRAMLSDFREKGLYLYVAERLPPNLEVVFQIDHPDHFELVGKVVWCQYQPTSTKVLAEQPFPYRIGMGFHHESEVSSKVFAEFCARMMERYQTPRMLFEGQPTIQLKSEEETTDVAAATPVPTDTPHLQAVASAPDAPAESAEPSASTDTPADATGTDSSDQKQAA